MKPDAFLHAFLRAPDEVPVAAGTAFLRTCLQTREHRDLLLAWLAAASRGNLLPAAATMLLRALMDDHPAVALVGAERAVNIVGTGGGLPTFNISTAAAFAAAACNVPVLKTGSHAYSSRCGALDVQARLGVLAGGGREVLDECLHEFGLAFVPQTHYSPLVRALVASLVPMPVRLIGRLLNLIGPLLCPYRVAAQVIGVAETAMLEPYAEFVTANSRTPTWLVHALCGMDELCSLSENRVLSLADAPAAAAVDPTALACRRDEDIRAEIWPLAGAADADAAARRIEGILAGKGHPVQAQTVALNAAAAIHVAGAAPSFADAYRQALAAIADGAPARLLGRLRHAIQRRQGACHFRNLHGESIETHC